MKVWKRIYENKFILFFIAVYALALTAANEFFFASERMQNWDPAIYQYIGSLIVKGKMPYVDAFDHKGPLLYIFYALGYLIDKKWGIWLINFLFMAAILYVSIKIANKFVSKLASVTVCFVIYSGFILLDFRGGTPEYYAGLFVALSLYYLIDYYKKSDISKKNLLFLGISGAAVFWLKHSVLITILIICFFIIIELTIRKKYQKIFKFILWYGVGFCIPSLMICAWLVLNHAWTKMIEDYFIANISYAGNISLLSRAEAFLYLAFHTSVVVCWVMFLIYIFIQINKKENQKKHTSHNIIFHGCSALFLSLVFFALPGRNYYHYLSSLFPLMIFTVAAILGEIEFKEVWMKHIAYAAGLILVIGLVVYPNLMQTPSVCSGAWTADQSRQDELDVIKQYTKNDDKIAVLGGSAGQYLSSGLDSATTYPYITQAVLYSPERTADYKNQIIKNKPAVIITEPLYDEYDILGYDVLNDYYLCKTIDSRNIYVIKDRLQNTDTAVKDNLGFIIDMETYLSEVSRLDDCTVFLTVKDTPGKLSDESLRQMKRMGVDHTSEFNDDEKHSFTGIIRDGEFIYQNIGDEDEVLQYDYAMGECTVHMESKPSSYGNMASVKINDTEYAVNNRGWNIVVYNNKTYEVMDSVAFDTASEQYRCYRKN